MEGDQITIPDMYLGKFGQLLLHVFLQLSWSQNRLADWTNWCLSVIETLHFAWIKRRVRELKEMSQEKKSVSGFSYDGG